MPSAEEITQRTAAVGASLKAAQAEGAKQMEKEAVDEAEAAADPYGAILGYHDPAHDVAVIFTKVCSFTEDENKRYGGAYDRLRKMLDRELYMHAADESIALCDVIVGVLGDLQNGRISLSDEDVLDERRRKLRSALISYTSALQIHQEQTIRQARETFGRNTSEAKAVGDLFNDLKRTSFEYRWLEELRDALQHGDINAFKCQFTARLHGEPEVKVDMDREYMLDFTKAARKKSWLNRNELKEMSTDPSVLDMVQAIRPKMRELQDKLDKALYPNVADDAAVVKELVGRFNGRRGLYALQTGPGFTRRLAIPPFRRLAPRVLAFADTYPQAGD